MFATADGYIQIVALRETHVQALLELVGAPELYEQYSDPNDRVKGTDAFNAILEPTLAAQPTAHWLEALASIGVPAAPIQDLAASTSDAQLDHRLITTQIPDPGKPEEQIRVISAGHVTAPAPPAVQRAAPTLGEHTDEILAELGYTAGDILELRNAEAI